MLFIGFIFLFTASVFLNPRTDGGRAHAGAQGGRVSGGL